MGTNKTIIKLFSAVVLLAFSTVSMAEDTSGCGFLIIYLKTKPGVTCALVSHKQIHGWPAKDQHLPYVMPNHQISYAVRNSYDHGPDLKMTFHCSNEKAVTIESIKDFGFLEAGAVTGKTSDKHMASYHSHKGSCKLDHNKPGEIHWLIG